MSHNNSGPYTHTTTTNSNQVAYEMPQQTVFADPPIKDYFVQSILSTIFCCLFTGIAAIYKSVKVRDHLRDGNRYAAADASRQAKILNIVGLVFGIIVYIIIIVVVAVYVAAVAAAFSGSASDFFPDTDSDSVGNFPTLDSKEDFSLGI